MMAELLWQRVSFAAFSLQIVFCSCRALRLSLPPAPVPSVALVAQRSPPCRQAPHPTRHLSLWPAGRRSIRVHSGRPATRDKQGFGLLPDDPGGCCFHPGQTSRRPCTCTP